MRWLPSFEPDGLAYPWVQDLAGWWHLRPTDDRWIVDMTGPNAHSVCGRTIASVHVSEYDRDPGEDNICPTCAAFASGGSA